MFEPSVAGEGDEFERVLTRRDALSLVAGWDVNWCPEHLVKRAALYLFPDVGWRLPARPARFRGLRRQGALFRDDWLLNAAVPIKLHTVRAALDLARDLDRSTHRNRCVSGAAVSLGWFESALHEVGLTVGLVSRVGSLALVPPSQRSVAVGGARLGSAIDEALHRHGVKDSGPHDDRDLRRACLALADTTECLAVFRVGANVHNVTVPADPWATIP